MSEFHYTENAIWKNATNLLICTKKELQCSLEVFCVELTILVKHEKTIYNKI